MKAAIYCRVSTKDQEREGTSLQSQLDACEKLAQERGYEVPEGFTIMETYSGLSIDRPKLNEIRQWVRDDEVDAVIAYTLDRLSRDPVHFIILQEELDRAGVMLIMVTEDVDSSDMGKLIAHIKGFAAKLEAEKIKERTMRGKRTKALQGKMPNGRKLYGYNYVLGEGVRVLNEEESKWVKTIFTLLVEERLSLLAIAKRLNTLGVPTPTGGTFWRPPTIHRILKNPSYAGRTYAFTQKFVEPKRRIKPNTKIKKTRLVWKPRGEWIEIPNATPAIISEELFGESQKILKRNRELSSRNARRQYLLSGHILCKRCGRRYIGYARVLRKPNGKKYESRYYLCGASKKELSPIPCDNKRLEASATENAVWEQIEAILSDPEVVFAELKDRQHEADKTSFLERNLETVRERLKFKEKEKNRIHKAFSITGDESKFRKDIADLTEEVKALRQEETSLESRIEANKKFALNLEGIKQACELVKNNLTSLSFKEKRLALEALQIKVIAGDLNITVEGVIPIQREAIVFASPRQSFRVFYPSSHASSPIRETKRQPPRF